MTVATKWPVLERLLARRSNAKREKPTELRLSRSYLPVLCREVGYTQGAEIGVWKGAYSAAFCEANPYMHMLCVDPWLSYPAWLDTKNDMPHEQAVRLISNAHAIAEARLKPLNCTIMRAFSEDAANAVLDASLDVVYIDANHTRAAVLQDLEAWAPKVKPGGLIGGHDYRQFPNKPTIHVIEAVQAYTKAHRIDPWFTLMGDKTPSFLWVVN